MQEKHRHNAPFDESKQPPSFEAGTPYRNFVEKFSNKTTKWYRFIFFIAPSENVKFSLQKKQGAYVD